MTSTVFTNHDDSHHHSLQTLNMLYEYDDFMFSIKNMVDMGCGSGQDLEWWATRTTRDENPQPLNIRCLGIDQADSLAMAHRHRNIQYQPHDFESPFQLSRKFDVIWCHDAFQYVINPFQTLANWWQVMNDDGMLVLILPQTTNLEFNDQAFDQRDYCYHHWTLVNLIHTLAVSGFDCRDGFFLKRPEDPWLHAIVYRSSQAPRDPRKTSWFDLAQNNLLPDTVINSYNRFGYVRQRDLTLPWLDHSLTWYGQQ